MTTSTSFAGLLQAFFTDRLLQQRRASTHTVASYRDTFRLLLRFAQERLGIDPSALSLDNLDARFIGEFLDHVERARGNTARTRNIRLAAVHAFFRYVSICEPAHADRCRRILAIPAKRHERRPIAFLQREEVDALLGFQTRPRGSADVIGRSLLVAIQTGLRVSELTHLRCEEVILGTGAHLRCEGKGRKQRCTPLRRETAAVMAAWLRERNGAADGSCSSPVSGAECSAGCRASVSSANHAKTRTAPLSLACTQARDPARPAPYGGHGPASARRRPRGDRPLARARVRGNDPDVSPRGPAFEGAGARTHRPRSISPRAATNPADRLLAFLDSL